MIRGTAKELGEKFQVEYPVIFGFLKFMERWGVARVVEQRKGPNGKGKPSAVWELPEVINLKLE